MINVPLERMGSALLYSAGKRRVKFEIHVIYRNRYLFTGHRGRQNLISVQMLQTGDDVTEKEGSTSSRGTHAHEG